MSIELRCPACEARFDDRWRCGDCHSPLEFAYSQSPIDRESLSLADGVWGFSELLAVDQAVSLGAGATPLVESPWNCEFKLEYVAPTGSFKDRGATTVIARAVDVGADALIEDSSGNAGGAVATYAGRAGMDCTIFVPESAPESKIQPITRSGATVERIGGSRQDVVDACVGAVEDGAGWYASHAWNPAFFEGTATMAYEIAIQRDWSLPDALIIPVGHGTLLLGVYRGFKRLQAAGLIASVPRLLGVQAAGYAPIADSLHESVSGHNDVADGIHITEPVRNDQLFTAIESTAGDCIAIEREPVERALNGLHANGFYVEPTSAVAVAGLERYRKLGVLDRDDDVVVPLTGSGLKK